MNLASIAGTFGTVPWKLVQKLEAMEIHKVMETIQIRKINMNTAKGIRVLMIFAVA